MSGISDATFPSLNAALDTDAMVERLRQALPECAESVRLESAAISDIRYQPGKHCVILYRVKAIDNATGHSTKEMVAGTMLLANEEPDVQEPEMVERFASDKSRIIRTPSVYLSDMRMAVTVYPFDPSLPWMFDALDGHIVKRGLAKGWAAKNVRVRKAIPSVLGYTPRARAGFEYQVITESTETGETTETQIIGKVHSFKRPERLYAAGWALWRESEGRLGLAPPSGYISPLRMTLQERVPGERLGGLAGSPGIVDAARATARAVAILHSLSVPLHSRRTPQQEGRIVNKWAGTLKAIRPDLAMQLDGLTARLVPEIEANTLMSGPVHGDFHHTNVLADGDEIKLIDLDEMAFGDPLVDVGRLLASLRIPSLRVFGDPDGLIEAREAFLEEYLRITGADERRVRIFEAGFLLTAAASSFRIQRRDWHTEAAVLVEQSRKTFDSLHVGARTVERASAASPELTIEQRLRWATDSKYMQALLAPIVRETFGGASIEKCRVKGWQESSNGFRVKYTVKGRRKNAPWSATLKGYLKKDLSGKKAVRGLEPTADALTTVEDAPLSPRRVGHLPTLGMTVLEPPQGDSLASPIGEPEGLRGARRLNESRTRSSGL